MIDNLKNYLGSFLSIAMNITTLSHAKYYLNSFSFAIWLKLLYKSCWLLTYYL